MTRVKLKKNKRISVVEEKKKQLIAIGLKLFITYQMHIGHKKKKINEGVLRDYIIGYYRLRAIYNPNIMIIEIRRMLYLVMAHSSYSGGVIIHVPRKRLESRISKIDITDGEFGANIENIMDDLRVSGLYGRYSIITRWVGGLISNYKFIKRKMLMRFMPKHRRPQGPIEKEKQMGQLLNIIDPSIYIGFTEEGSADNESRLVGVKSFTFIDTDYRDTIKDNITKNVRVKIPINLSVKVISTMIFIINQQILKAYWTTIRYTEKELYMTHIRNKLLYKREFFTDEESRIAYEIKKINAKSKVVKYQMYRDMKYRMSPFIKC